MAECVLSILHVRRERVRRDQRSVGSPDACRHGAPHRHDLETNEIRARHDKGELRGLPRRELGRGCSASDDARHLARSRRRCHLRHALVEARAVRGSSAVGHVRQDRAVEDRPRRVGARERHVPEPELVETLWSAGERLGRVAEGPGSGAREDVEHVRLGEDDAVIQAKTPVTPDRVHSPGESRVRPVEEIDHEDAVEPIGLGSGKQRAGVRRADRVDPLDSRAQSRSDVACDANHDAAFTVPDRMQAGCGLPLAEQPLQRFVELPRDLRDLGFLGVVDEVMVGGEEDVALAAAGVAPSPPIPCSRSECRGRAGWVTDSPHEARSAVRPRPPGHPSLAPPCAVSRYPGRATRVDRVSRSGRLSTSITSA